VPLNASINLALAAADTRSRAPQRLKPLTLEILVARLKSCPSRGCAKKSLRAEAFGVRIALRQEGYGRDARSPTIIRSKLYCSVASFSITTFTCAVTSLCSFTGTVKSPTVFKASCSWILRRSMLKPFLVSASAKSPEVTDPNN
jgi:hypothetical protein